MTGQGAFVTHHEHGCCGHICSGGVSCEGDILGVNAPFFCVVTNVRHNVDTFVNLPGELSIGGEGVVDTHNRCSCEVAEGAGDAVMSVDVSDDPSATVHIDDKGQSVLGTWAVVAHAYLAVASRSVVVGGNGDAGAALVPESAFCPVCLAHIVEALAGDVGVFCELTLCVDHAAHLFGPQARNVVLVTHE